jgi:hypothetical protein
MVHTIQNLKNFEFHQHLESLEHVINIIMWIRDMGCYSKAIRSKMVGGYVPYLIHNVLKDVEAHQLHESIQQVLDLPHHPMQHKKMRKQPLNLGRLETIVLDIHESHLPMHHDPSRVKLFGDVQLRRQPKNLSKLS